MSDFATEVLSNIVQKRDCARPVFRCREFVRPEDLSGVTTHVMTRKLQVWNREAKFGSFSHFRGSI